MRGSRSGSDLSSAPSVQHDADRNQRDSSRPDRSRYARTAGGDTARGISSGSHTCSDPKVYGVLSSMECSAYDPSLNWYRARDW
jgi:hypothetical protein